MELNNLKPAKDLPKKKKESGEDRDRVMVEHQPVDIKEQNRVQVINPKEVFREDKCHCSVLFLNLDLKMSTGLNIKLSIWICYNK